MNLFKPVAIAAIAVMLSSAAVYAHAPGSGGERQKRGFETLDANRDGAVSLEEFKAAKRAKQAAKADKVDTMFKRIDKNADGKVDKAEFDAWRAARRGKHQNRKDHKTTK